MVSLMSVSSSFLTSFLISLVAAALDLDGLSLPPMSITRQSESESDSKVNRRFPAGDFADEAFAEADVAAAGVVWIEFLPPISVREDRLEELRLVTLGADPAGDLREAFVGVIPDAAGPEEPTGVLL